MIHPSTLVLIDKLCEMTRQKKIAWQMGEDNTIVHDTEGYRVVLTQDPEELILADALGRELERADVQELAETMTEDGKPYAEPVGMMIRDAARVAKGTEFAIEKVLASLDLDGDGIPDLPAPPGMEAMIAEELGEAPTPEDIVAVTTEDVTEETSPFIVSGTPAPDTVPEPVAEAVEEQIEAAPQADPDVASAVQQMADKINGGTVETVSTNTSGQSLSGFGTFAAGATALGGMGIVAASTAKPASDAIEAVVEDAPDLSTIDITAPTDQITETVTEASAAALDDVTEVTGAIEDAAESRMVGVIDDIEGTIETAQPDFGGFPEVPTDTSAISDGAAALSKEAAEDLSDGEQSIANMLESMTAPEQAPAPEPAAPQEPQQKPMNFSLSGIAKGVGIGGLAAAGGSVINKATESAADSVSDTASAATEAVADTASTGTHAAAEAIADAGADAEELSGKVNKSVGGVLGAATAAIGDAKDKVEDTGSNAADGARKLVDDIGDDAKDVAEKAKPTTRFNPWN